ncbi:MAG TPA: beta-glucosidase BglX [Opitutaceae bacterium]
MRPYLRLSALGLLLATALRAQTPSWVTPDREARVAALLAQMTLEEKIGQLNQLPAAFDPTGPVPTGGRERDAYQAIREGKVGSMLNVVGAEATRALQQLAVENSRLRIPLLFGYDVIHGYRTMFPVPLGEAASWDLDAIEHSARVAATEAAAAGLHWTFAPMVDVSRDARWGRIMEGAGEDPHLGSLVAVARIRGFQGPDLGAPDTIAACAKHFAAYGFAEGGRDYNSADISDDTLHNVVLPPFHAAARAGVATFMNSFNEIGGVPATASARLQREILKGAWGFQGFVVSDWGSIDELVQHGVARDEAEAARLAITAGSDMDMCSEAYIASLGRAIAAGQVDERLIDDAVRRILRVKAALGLFDAPHRYSDPQREQQTLRSEAHLAAARDVARKSIVLLRNEGGLLPLVKNAKTIAVIGPLADDRDSPLGSWRAQAEPDSAVSLLEGVRRAAGPDTRVVHAEGARLTVGKRGFKQSLTFNTSDRSGFPAAIAAARDADVVVLALGEDAFQSGEGRSQADISLKGLQLELLRAIQEVNQRIVVVLMNGRPLAIADWADSVPAIVEAWHGGSQAGLAIADVLFGDYNPSGRLPVSFPRHVGQVPLSYNRKNTGRPSGASGEVFWSHYEDTPNTPLYPFGFGLSYTTFDYSAPRLSADTLAPGGTLDVAVTVANHGAVKGRTVVQLYVRDLVGSVTRPVKELKGFRLVELAPGETREVSFRLTPADLAFYTAQRRWEAEPGEFHVFTGGSSAEVKKARFTLTE